MRHDSVRREHISLAGAREILDVLVVRRGDVKELTIRDALQPFLSLRRNFVVRRIDVFEMSAPLDIFGLGGGRSRKFRELLQIELLHDFPIRTDGNGGLVLLIRARVLRLVQSLSPSLSSSIESTLSADALSRYFPLLARVLGTGSVTSLISSSESGAERERKIE